MFKRTQYDGLLLPEESSFKAVGDIIPVLDRSKDKDEEVVYERLCCLSLLNDPVYTLSISRGVKILELKFQGINNVSFKDDYITVLVGTGEFVDNDGEKYEINSIKLPMLADGKHISVFDKEFKDKSVVMDMSYGDGKIISFTCKHVEHWERS